MLSFVLRLYEFLIILRAILSWFGPDPYNQYYQLLIRVTEPVLKPIRQVLPSMGIDLSPLIAILLIDLIRGLVAGQLFR
ncbi:MAG: YggT family protein [Candidatus Cloacimonetes bacterium]|nr:YggT family protein [Candidatus Cloacimonadota bacterium]